MSEHGGPEMTRRRRPTGRRAGDSGTRDAILDAALELFAERGYDGASMRAIATRAGVDPALIRHFFGDKDTLFATAVADRSAIPQAVGAAFAGDPATIGHRVADAYLGLWEDPAMRPILLAIVRSATTSPGAAEMLREILGARMLAETGAGDTDDRARHVILAAAHLIGIAVTRYVLALPPIATMTHDELVDQVAPMLQQHLAAVAGAV